MLQSLDFIIFSPQPKHQHEKSTEKQALNFVLNFFKIIDIQEN